MSHLKPLLCHAVQLTRFATVGLLCFGLGIGVLVGLHELAGVHYLIAYGASFVASSTTGYLLNSRFTFGTAARAMGVLRYLGTNTLLLLLNGAALRLLVEYFHMGYLAGTLLLAGINTPIGFMAHRVLSYRLKWRLSPGAPAESGN